MCLLACGINFICRLKTGTLQIHSPMLYSISNVPSWDRAVAGLLRMYGAEVLCKFPIMQHVLFGSCLSFEKDDEAQSEEVRRALSITPQLYQEHKY